MNYRPLPIRSINWNYLLSILIKFIFDTFSRTVIPSTKQSNIAHRVCSWNLWPTTKHKNSAVCPSQVVQDLFFLRTDAPLKRIPHRPQRTILKYNSPHNPTPLPLNLFHSSIKKRRILCLLFQIFIPQPILQLFNHHFLNWRRSFRRAMVPPQSSMIGDSSAKKCSASPVSSLF